MSLRVRLSLILGSTFISIWSLTMLWSLLTWHDQMMLTLDQRLAASARMVAGLLTQMPSSDLQSRLGQPLNMEHLGISQGLACQVSSVRGEILARNTEDSSALLEAHVKGFHEQNIGGVLWRSFTLFQGDLRITTADRLEEREALQRSLWLTTALPVVFALLGSLALLWWGITQGLSPLTHLSELLSQRRPDDLDALPNTPVPVELRPLVHTLNQLLHRMATTLERERRFTGDAAHELRSPLTAIKTHLQVALMTEGATAEQALRHAEEGTDRLHHTLEQLLLLARLEGKQLFDDGQQQSVEQIIQCALQDTDSGQRHRIHVRLSEEAYKQYINIPSNLAIIAVRNLLDNALRHTPPNTPVSLVTCLKGPQIHIQVCDQGSSLSQQDMEQLTQRFWRKGHAVGTGLGLSIVQAIVQYAGGALRLCSQAQGLCISLEFPLNTSSNPAS